MCVAVLMPSAGRKVQFCPPALPATRQPSGAGRIVEKRLKPVHSAYSCGLTVCCPRTFGARLGNLPSPKGLAGVPPKEPTMISLKVLSTAAIMALVFPIMVPSASFADPPHRGGPPAGPRPAVRGGGGNFHPGGGGPGPRYGGGGGGGGYHRGG